MRKTLCTVVLSSGVGVIPSLQQLTTIPERIARGENPVYLSLTRETVDPSLADIVAASSLIVEGTVAPLRTYLSGDKQWVYTDYSISPTFVIFQQKRQTRSTPGQEPLILKVGGGKLTVDGVEVVAVDENLQAWKPDAHVILFLTESRTDPGKYELVFEVSGGFDLTTGKIRPLLKGDWMLKDIRGISKGDFMKRIYQTLDSRGFASE